MRSLVIDVSRIWPELEAKLRLRMEAMRESLERNDLRKPVDVHQSQDGTPVHANMRGFGLYLQVLAHPGDPVQSLRAFLDRAMHPETRWMRDHDMGAVDAARRGAWQTMKAIVGDIGNGCDYTPTTPHRDRPLCDNDAALGPSIRFAPPERVDDIARAIAIAFDGIPDVSWCYAEKPLHGRARDFRFGDETNLYADIAELDALSKLRAIAKIREINGFQIAA